MDAFIIPFKGLDVGNHRYDFEIGKTFFEHFAYFETDKGEISLRLDLEKETNLMVLRFALEGYMTLACDRCLAEFDFPVKGEFRLIVKFGDSFQEESDEIIVIPSTDSRLDISQYIFEFINLLLPIQKTHPDIAQCDKKMVEKLAKTANERRDPRWDALRDIKLK
ncbi:MAG: DUF177 domain-containing protein [bacterium]